LSSVEDRVKKIVERRGISPKNQKVMWARMAVCKHYLIKTGAITREDFDKEEARLVADISRNIENNVRKELGLEPVK
jgi:hypothetical protein